MSDSRSDLSLLFMTHTDCELLNEQGITHTLTCMLSVDYVQCTIWRSGILEHFGQKHSAAWDSLRGLHQVGVATHHPNGKHPQGNHGGEVERGDASTHSDGQAVGVGVHVLGDGG